MILGILAIIVAFIPCFGWWALVMAIVGVVLSAVSLNQAKKVGASKGMAVTGLICSIVAIIIVIVWMALFASAVGAVADAVKDSGAMDSLNKAMEELKNITDTLQNHEN